MRRRLNVDDGDAVIAAPLLLIASFVAPSEGAVARVVADDVTAPLPARLERVTRAFKDAPYVLSPLGEGPGGEVDTDPRLRLDAFDCTTFVETALALALSPTLDDARAALDAIRYQRGEITFAARRHFPEAEWIPQLVQAGLLEDITRAVGGADVTIETKKLDASVWKKARHPGLPQLEDARIPAGVFSLPVWSLDAAARAPERIPPGTILHLVRKDFGSVPVRVSHQGIVLDVDGKRVLRHAADRLHHRVVDEPLDAFFARMKKYGKWPVTGVHLTRVAATAGWRERLVAPPSTTTAPTTPTR